MIFCHLKGERNACCGTKAFQLDTADLDLFLALKVELKNEAQSRSSETFHGEEPPSMPEAPCREKTKS